MLNAIVVAIPFFILVFSGHKQVEFGELHDRSVRDGKPIKLSVLLRYLSRIFGPTISREQLLNAVLSQRHQVRRVRLRQLSRQVSAACALDLLLRLSRVRLVRLHLFAIE